MNTENKRTVQERNKDLVVGSEIEEITPPWIANRTGKVIRLCKDSQFIVVSFGGKRKYRLLQHNIRPKGGKRRAT